MMTSIGYPLSVVRATKAYRKLEEEDRQQLERIEFLNDTYGDEPDGAFMALMEEQGVDSTDLCWYSEVMAEIEGEIEANKPKHNA